MPRLLTRFALSTGLAVMLAVPAPATAVIILDSTWTEEGGSDAEPSAGFDAAKALANQPQFGATVAMAENDGEPDWGECSGTWIGNDPETGQAYVLTAAHCFPEGSDADSYVYRGHDGTVLEGTFLVTHANYVDDESTTGNDLAIVLLSDGLDAPSGPAVLYGGNREEGALVTFVGYGSRGIASVGEHQRYYDGKGDKAAAQGVVEPIADTDDGDDRASFAVFLPAEDGSVENPYGGPETPPSRLAGLLGTGDSGGSAYLKVGSRWFLAGVNSAGSGEAQYGDTSSFVRLSARQDWIAEHAPVATFGE